MTIFRIADKGGHNWKAFTITVVPGEFFPKVKQNGHSTVQPLFWKKFVNKRE